MINLAHLRALLTAAEEAHAACNADPSPGNLGIEGAAENALELAALKAFPSLLAIAEAACTYADVTRVDRYTDGCVDRRIAAQLALYAAVDAARKAGT